MFLWAIREEAIPQGLAWRWGLSPPAFQCAMKSELRHKGEIMGFGRRTLFYVPKAIEASTVFYPDFDATNFVCEEVIARSDFEVLRVFVHHLAKAANIPAD